MTFLFQIVRTLLQNHLLSLPGFNLELYTYSLNCAQQTTCLSIQLLQDLSWNQSNIFTKWPSPLEIVSDNRKTLQGCLKWLLSTMHKQAVTEQMTHTKLVTLQRLQAQVWNMDLLTQVGTAMHLPQGTPGNKKPTGRSYCIPCYSCAFFHINTQIRQIRNYQICSN